MWKKHFLITNLKKYWSILLLVTLIFSYIYGRSYLQSELRKNGKCTIGTRISTIKFSSKDHSGTIEYYVKNKKYSINSPKSIIVGYQVYVVYDSLNPTRAAIVDTCIGNNMKDLKIDF